ncbi:multicopper oxidase domain-containing protein [Pontibacillus sp. HMF3514]|nr:multicopper oxidase family protein [Pontibacillus sp. HMF3514]QHE52359.1 multicopper oxidase domain-containing protein [Pontibacillus sp. HMF3514]
MRKLSIILFIIGIGFVSTWGVLNFWPSDSAKQALKQNKGKSILDFNVEAKENQPVKTFNVTAKQTEWKINNQTSTNAWTYNGTVPGKEIRVQEGDFVKIHLKNKLDVPVTIHWHGVILPNKMDGVPDVTQEAVQPGESFTYEFSADDAGTYWYHSHQHSSKQVDKGLYGAFIVESKEKTYTKDHTLILDEWAVNQEKQSFSNMRSMMMGGMSGNGEADTEAMYDTFTINGKNGDSIQPIQLKKGEKARLRFVNAGYQVHTIRFPKESMKVLAVDGESVQTQTNQSSNLLEIAPGERIDVEYVQTNQTTSLIRDMTSDESEQSISIPFQTGQSNSKNQNSHETQASSNTVNGTTFSSENLIFNQTPKNVDVSYEMKLDMGMNMGEGMVFQINNDTFPDTNPIDVAKGDLVKVRLTNQGMLNHPMHLHGHRFQVVKKMGIKQLL